MTFFFKVLYCSNLSHQAFFLIGSDFEHTTQLLLFFFFSEQYVPPSGKKKALKEKSQSTNQHTVYRNKYCLSFCLLLFLGFSLPVPFKNISSYNPMGYFTITLNKFTRMHGGKHDNNSISLVWSLWTYTFWRLVKTFTWTVNFFCTVFPFQISNCMTECSVKLIQFDQALEFLPLLCCPMSKASVLLALISHTADHPLINSSISVNNGFIWKELNQWRFFMHLF